MQLVERRLISLDDSSIIGELLPELASKKILTGFKEENGKRVPVLIDQEKHITPRMLMNHTYGGGHSYFNPLLNEYLKEGWEKRNEAADPHQTVLDSPLLWQPGTHTNYGQGFDWLAVLIERVTKRSLAEYLQENIFNLLGLKSMGYEETYGGNVTSQPESKKIFWPRSFKQPDGTFVPLDPPVLEKVERDAAWPEGKYHTSPLGTGLVSSAADFAHLLTILSPSNNGVDPVTGHRLLSASSIREITSPQLPPHLRNDSRNVPSAIPGMIFPANLQAPNMDPEGSFGLGCGIQGEDRKLEDGKRGRSKGSVYWYSANNVEYWVDREKGIVLVVVGNYFPWNEESWVSFVAGVEGRVYEGLK